MILTYRYRLLSTKRQHRALERICEEQRVLYNAALEERIDCYRKTGKSRSYMSQCKALTIWRHSDPDASAMPLNIQRWTLRRLDEAYESFFRRVKRSKLGAGFPRFRSKDRWTSFGFAEFVGIHFKNKRLRFTGLPGGLRTRLHRQLPEDANIKSCVFTRVGRKWFICFHVNTAVAGREGLNVAHESERGPDNLAHTCETLPSISRSARAAGATNNLTPLPYAIGIDLGLKVFAHCSDGSVINNPRISRRSKNALRRKQRALARCRRGSNRRRKVRDQLARQHRKIANTRATWLHQQSAALINRTDLIVAEDLKISNMIRSAKGTIEQPGKNIAAKTGLNRSIHDAAWGRFLGMISYKAELTGKSFIMVNPRNTSQHCSGCNELVPKRLAIRTHACPHCGLVIDRDWNASLNILRAGLPAGWITRPKGVSVQPETHVLRKGLHVSPRRLHIRAKGE